MVHECQTGETEKQLLTNVDVGCEKVNEQNVFVKLSTVGCDELLIMLLIEMNHDTTFKLSCHKSIDKYLIVNDKLFVSSS